ncbi:MAG: hypothetical protein HY823_14480 [Acidobacteria bacterium]|nr:hypothetical protein [Acidobacteriota bacterium]
MSMARKFHGTALAFLLAGGAVMNAQALSGVGTGSGGSAPPAGSQPKTLVDFFKLHGIPLKTGGPAIPTGRLGAPQPAIVAPLSLTGQTPLTAKVDYYTQDPSATYGCTQVGVWGGTYPPIPGDFTTLFTATLSNPTSANLEVTYTAQVNLGDEIGGAVDGIALIVIVEQTQGGSPAMGYCANSDQLPFLATRPTDGRGSSSLISYTGWVTGIVPGANAVTVRVMAATGIAHTNFELCYGNLIIRY